MIPSSVCTWTQRTLGNSSRLMVSMAVIFIVGLDGAPKGVWWRYFTQRCPQMRMPSVQHGHSLWGRAVIPFSHPAEGRTTRGRKSVVSLAQKLRSQMALPVIGAPMFIVSNPDLVIAQCESGVI